MSELPIEAKICEINDGAYYPVRLIAVPHVGELIHLWSHLNSASGHEPKKNYEVVQVVHHLTDVSEEVARSKGGSHSVCVYVKPASGKFFV